MQKNLSLLDPAFLAPKGPPPPPPLVFDIEVQGTNVNGLFNVGLTQGNPLVPVAPSGGPGGVRNLASGLDMIWQGTGSGGSVFLYDATRLAVWETSPGSGNRFFVNMPARANPSSPWIMGMRFYMAGQTGQNSDIWRGANDANNLWWIGGSSTMFYSSLGSQIPPSLTLLVNETKDVMIGYDGTNSFLEMDGIRSSVAGAYRAPPDQIGGGSPRVLLTRMARADYDANATALMLTFLNTPYP